jgi:hypothetical protein
MVPDNFTGIKHNFKVIGGLGQMAFNAQPSAAFGSSRNVGKENGGATGLKRQRDSCPVNRKFRTLGPFAPGAQALFLESNSRTAGTSSFGTLIKVWDWSSQAASSSATASFPVWFS